MEPIKLLTDIYISGDYLDREAGHGRYSEKDLNRPTYMLQGRSCFQELKLYSQGRRCPNCCF